jgi:DnaK suppressor protein
MANPSSADLRAALLAAREQHSLALELFKADLVGAGANPSDDYLTDESGDDDYWGGDGASRSARSDTSALAGIAFGMVEQIDLALRKLGEGTYGRCDGCGGQIEAERLEALPTTWRCSTCADRSNNEASVLARPTGDRPPLFSGSDSPFSPSWQPLPPNDPRHARFQSWWYHDQPITAPPSKRKTSDKLVRYEPESGAHIWQERAHELRELNASALKITSLDVGPIKAAYTAGLRTESTIEYWKTHKDPKRVTPLVQPADLYRHKPRSPKSN